LPPHSRLQAEPAPALPLPSIVIPVYNDRQTLGQVLAAVSRALPGVRKNNIVVIQDVDLEYDPQDWAAM
jgi:hypothetical protein